MEKIGELIRDAREEKDLSLAQLSRMSGIDRRTISTVEKTSNGGYYTINSILIGLGMELTASRKVA